MSEANTPHSVVYYINFMSEVQPQRPDGLLSNMPVEKPLRYNGALHYTNKQEALEGLKVLTEKIKVLIIEEKERLEK